MKPLASNFLPTSSLRYLGPTRRKAEKEEEEEEEEEEEWEEEEEEEEKGQDLEGKREGPPRGCRTTHGGTEDGACLAESRGYKARRKSGKREWGPWE